jgi:riboflavin kinase/FMN adenylyltransferase
VQTFFSLDQPITDQPVVLTIGKFDGVHLGHQRLINTAVQRARAAGFACAVLTFDPHPRMVLTPQQPPRLLTSIPERAELVAALGAAFFVVVPFTRETMQTPALEYMQQICHALPLRELWVGEGFALGRKREGTVERLSEIGGELGYTVGTVAPVNLEGEMVSASRVRDLLAAGAVERAARLLGRPFSVQGEVQHGAKLGRTIGFPTANLGIPAEHAIPADGVYVTRAYLANKPINAVTSIGVRPTIAGNLRRTVEAYLLDWAGDIYGETLRLAFLHRLREERKFDTIDALVAQMQRDVGEARACFARADSDEAA